MYANMESNITADAMKQAYDPWSIPDTYTLFQMTPEDMRHFLHPHWHNQKAPHPMIFYALGLWYLILLVVGGFGNLCVIRIFGGTPALRTPSNMLVMNLAISDMLLLITMLPACVYNFLSGGPWAFGEASCYAQAFCGALMGGVQIFTLTIISWDRYNVIVKGMAGTPLTFKKASVFIIFAWLWSLLWAIGPLFGFGKFTLDSLLGSCSYDGLTTTANNKIYLTLYAAFMYFVNVTTIAGCYFFIVQAVFKHEDEMREQAKKMNVSSLRSGEQNAVSAEIRIAKVAIINVSLWLISWTPYMVFCLMGVWGDQSGITPVPSMLQSLLAKTSCAYNPVIYCLSHPKFREILKQQYPWMCIVVENKTRKTGGDSTSTNSSTTVTDSS